MDLKKVIDYLEKHQKAQRIFEQDYFRLGICEVILGNYSSAQSLFIESIEIMFGTNPFWLASSQPNWLVDIAILSGRSDLYSSIVNELNLYRKQSTKTQSTGSSPLAHYSYSVMEILSPSDGKIDEWIKDLLKRPKYKDLYASGFVLQAILDQEQNTFLDSMRLLLKAHEGLAKYGELRWIPEGWLCLPAMSLSFLGKKYGFQEEIENDYLSVGYLEYLLSKQ